jgi:hypothetical protein
MDMLRREPHVIGAAPVQRGHEVAADHSTATGDDQHA